MPKLDTLEPEFREKVLQIIADTRAATGLEWVITSGRRTMIEQQRLFAQGRTTPGAIVTRARPGQSAHNFGLAADLAPLKKGTQKIDWNAPDSTWKTMADIAQQHGLTAGYYFKSIHDAPHIEDSTWKTVQAEWKAGRLKVA